MSILFAHIIVPYRLYKYPYHEQLMIYAQRPDATACAEYDIWNKHMNRYIRRGAKGIALIDSQGDKPRIKYVFDVADTGGRNNSRLCWRTLPAAAWMPSGKPKARTFLLSLTILIWEIMI